MDRFGDGCAKTLITGVTGYVGGRLAGRFAADGRPFRVMVRGDASRLAGREWSRQADIVVGDVGDADAVRRAVQGVTTAYYLVHSMQAGTEFEARDLQYARTFGQVCADAGVQRVIYLGGLGDDEQRLSRHLKSRHDTGRALAESGVPVVELRAAVIVGSGSLSFEIVRHLAERLPVMIFPKWASTRIQPIAIADVLSYLIAADRQPETVEGHRIVEIGGASIETFGGMILKYASARGLKRFVIRVPVITPRLSSYWVHWTTPVTASIARPLIEGATNEVIVRDDSAKTTFPTIEPMAYEAAVGKALDRIDNGEIETIWSDARVAHSGESLDNVVAREQGLFIECREERTTAEPAAVYHAFCSLGGERGWPFHWLWRIRGWIDQAFGGVGLRRGRRHPDELRVGDALDFWRVEELEVNRRLLLRAEMKVPGDAWLRFEAVPESAGTLVQQTAFFAPRGALGLIYWYAIVPLHGLIFRAMVRTVVERAEEWAVSSTAATSTAATSTATTSTATTAVGAADGSGE